MTRLTCFLVVLVALASGCGFWEKHDEKDGEPEATVELRSLYQGWLTELAAASDQTTGWPSVADCDGTLWAGLAKAAGVASVKLEAAELAPGEVHRRPTPCWTPEAGDVGAKTTVSRDMLTGYIWGFWAAKDAAPLERLADYGASHGWEVGKPSGANEVQLGDNLKGALCRAIKVLTAGADTRSECAGAASVYLPVSADYARHLLVLGILLQGEVGAVPPFGLLAIDGEMLKRLHEQVDASPADALFQGALAVYTGDYSQAMGLLQDPGYQCPSYVRGAPTYCLVHKAFAAWIILKHSGGVTHASAE